MTSLLLHSNLSGPPQMNRHSFNQIEWSMTSTLNEWPTSLICDELELDFATHWMSKEGDVRQRVESIFIFIGSDPGWLGLAGRTGHQCEISDTGRRPAARALSLSQEPILGHRLHPLSLFDGET